MKKQPENPTPHAFSEIAITPGVRAEQQRHGSARAYARRLAPENDSGAALTARETAFLGARDGFFQATLGRIGDPEEGLTNAGIPLP